MAMNPGNTVPTPKGGGAPIIKSGHTTSGQFGDSPSMTRRTGNTPSDLNLKSN